MKNKTDESRPDVQREEQARPWEAGELPGEGLNKVQRALSLESLVVGKFPGGELRAIEEEPGGGLDEVLREAIDHRELRAVHCVQ